MKALGMIEVRGFLGAISASDAALKAADVTLLNAEVIKGGLTTIELVGDVAAVNAAVEAGVFLAKELDCLISSHVISRLDTQTETILTINGSEKESLKLESPVAQTADDDLLLMTEAFVPEAIEIVTPEQPESLNLLAELKNKKVADLRKEAYQLNVKQLKRSEIKSANKQALIDAIMAEIKGSDK